MTTATTTAPAVEVDERAAYTAGLRALADALDAHPEIPLPFDGIGTTLSIAFHGHEFETDRVAAMTSAARLLMPGQRTKHADNAYYRVRGALHGLRIEVWAMREQVCERVVRGTKHVTREVPDPDALAAVPTTTVTETIEDVEWVCRPLLADEPVSA